MRYNVVVVLGAVMILGVTTTIMYHMHTFVVSTCMHVVHSSGFRFGDGFECTYLRSSQLCSLLNNILFGNPLIDWVSMLLPLLQIKQEEECAHYIALQLTF